MDRSSSHMARIWAMSLFDWQKSDVAATAAFFSIVFCVRGSSTWAGEKRRRATRAPSSARRARAARPKIEPKRLVKCRRPSIPGHSPPHLADDRRRLLELLADHGHLLDVRRPRLLRVETLRALHELPLDLAELEQRRDDLRVAARSRRGEVPGRLHGSSNIPGRKEKTPRPDVAVAVHHLRLHGLVREDHARVVLGDGQGLERPPHGRVAVEVDDAQVTTKPRIAAINRMPASAMPMDTNWKPVPLASECVPGSAM